MGLLFGINGFTGYRLDKTGQTNSGLYNAHEKHLNGLT